MRGQVVHATPRGLVALLGPALRERRAEVDGIAPCQRQVLPGVGIDPVVVTAGTGLDALAGHDDRATIARDLDHAFDPAFEGQAVDDHQIGLRQTLGIGRAGLVDMGVGIGLDQGRDLDAGGNQFLRHVGQDGKARDELRPRGLRERGQGVAGSQRGAAKAQGLTTVQGHGVLRRELIRKPAGARAAAVGLAAVIRGAAKQARVDGGWSRAPRAAGPRQLVARSPCIGHKASGRGLRP
jgi:hypothetical protein